MERPVIKRLPLTKARNRLGSVVKRVHLNKEYFVLEKSGVPVAGIMDIDKLEDYLELQDPTVQRIIKKGYEEYLAGKSRPAEELLDEIKKEKAGKHKRARKK